jgi:hypothetical protein
MLRWMGCHGRVVRGHGDLVASGAGLVGAGLVGVFEIVVGLGGQRNLAASR